MKRPLDELDLGILRHLESDGRRSYSDIAEDLGVAVSTVSARVAKLIDTDAVRVVALINPHVVGLEAAATLLLDIEPNHFDETVDRIVGFPEVDYASMTAGAFNLVVDVFCRDADHLSELVAERLHVLPGVTDIHVAYQLRRYPVPSQRVGLIDHEDRVGGEQEVPTASGRATP
jgi:Lrp/AsnC family transcriptional regulator for asnA, asnC and gidA